MNALFLPIHRLKNRMNQSALPFRILLPTALLLLCLALPLSGCARSGNTEAPSGETAQNTASGTTSDLESGTESGTAAGTELSILCFSAGKADAFLLTTPNSTVIIDCGEKGFGKTILAELEARGITAVDYLIISHFDQDHVGGAARIINNITVKNVLQNNSPKDSEEYEKYIKAVNNASLEPVTVLETYTFTLDGVHYSIDPPRRSKYQDDTSNNSSLIISVFNGEDSFLFAGDARTERLAEFLDWNMDHYDVLKIPHHGKEEPLLGELIANVSPAWAVITSSDEEPEDAAMVNLIKAAGIEVFLTRTAPVIMSSSGTGVSVEYGAA